MRVHACALLVLLAACATPEPVRARRLRVLSNTSRTTESSQALANLRRAAKLPWKDDGRCVVAAADNPWRVVVERCFQTLDREKVRFRDVQHRCPVASADAASVQAMVGFCLMIQPELVVGAVVVVTAFVVAVAIVEAIDAYELRQREEAARKRMTKPPTVESAPDQKPTPSPEPKPGPLGPDLIPSSPDSTERRPECKPRPVPHRGGNNESNTCADRVPGNAFPGWDVLVNGKQFDALQPDARMLWEVKVYKYDTYVPYVRKIAIEKQIAELEAEYAIAKACGYSFTVGVSNAGHYKALRLAVRPEINIVLMDWCLK